MDYRLFGRTGLRVSQYFLGTMTFGEDWGWGADPEECRAILDTYLEAGGNVVDTANNYTQGASERIVGDLLKGRRDSVVLSTKYTLTLDGDDANGGGSGRKSLRRSLEQSLRRLGTDHVDVLWVHVWDQHTPVEETMRALDDVVRAGQVQYVGVSNTPAWVVARADALAELRGWTSFAGLQVPYSLVQRDVERELLPMADALGHSVAAWSPLAGGLLTGKFTRADRNPSGSTRLGPGSIGERDLGIARVVDEVADELGVPSSHVALAWTRAHRPGIHPVLGARSVEQLSDNLASAKLELSVDQLGRLDDAGAIGDTYPYDFVASNRWNVDGRHRAISG